MPLYEYECDACGHRFEVIQKFSDPLADTCPKCGGGVHKLMSSPAIQFKGSGWYITDYAKKDTTNAGKTGSSKEQDGSKDKDSGGSEKKDSEKKDSEQQDKGSATKSDSTSTTGPTASESTSNAATKPTTTKSDN